MKPILFTLALLSSFIFCSAQQLKVERKTIKNEEGNEVEAWVAHLDQEADDCMESYEAFMKKIFNINPTKENKTLLLAKEVQLHELSSLRLDQRTFFTGESAGTAVAFTFSPGYDIHFGSKTYSDEFEKGETFVKSFVKFHYKDFYNKKIKALQESIEEKQDDITSSDKKIDKNKKTILDNNTKISKGDSDGPKLKLKNETLDKENLNLSGNVSKERAEITILQEQLTKLNESLKKVEEF